MSTTEQDVKSAMTAPDQVNNPWPERLQQWAKFAQKMHERGTKIEVRYQDERDANQEGTMLNDIGGKKVNLFYSNVSVIKESLFNSLPKPSVTRLHKQDFDNDIARVAAMIVQRGLTYEIENSATFETAMNSAILDRLVPGIGVAWVSFEAAKTIERPPLGGIARPPRQVMESIVVDVVYWKDYIYEPQRVWEKVTWVGRRHYFDRDVAIKRWGSQAAAGNIASNAGGGNSIKTVQDQLITNGKVQIIEMWDKNTRSQIWLREDGFILAVTPDPYELQGFFPTPKPLLAAPYTSKFLPLPDYYMAQDQYRTMDTLYGRINLIIDAIRVAGVYDSSNPEIGRMLSGTENKLIPVDNWAMLAEKGGPAGVIGWFPVEQVAAVLQHLVTTFEFTKKQLFEVTGMADIIRGSTNQYETAQAQQIKAKFASIRMNGFQRDVGLFVRNVIRIVAEMMCQLYSVEKLSKICGQLPLEDQQFVQPALEVLRDDFQMSYNVAIEADSLTQSDWGQEQGERLEYVQVLSQFLTSAVPAAQEFPALAPLLVSMIKFASTSFKGSTELEGVLDKALQQLQQEGTGQEEKPDPAAAKAEMEMQKMQQEMDLKKQQADMDQQNAEAKLQFEREKHQQEMIQSQEKHQMEMVQIREKADLQEQIDATRAAGKMVQDERKFEQQQTLAAEKAKNEKEE